MHIYFEKVKIALLFSGEKALREEQKHCNLVSISLLLLPVSRRTILVIESPARCGARPPKSASQKKKRQFCILPMIFLRDWNSIKTQEKNGKKATERRVQKIVVVIDSLPFQKELLFCALSYIDFNSSKLRVCEVKMEVRCCTLVQVQSH